MLALLQGLFINKYTVYIVGIIIAIAVLIGAYFLWEHQIEAAAQLKFNNMQQAQNIVDQKKFEDQQAAIDAAQGQSVTDLSTFNASLAANLKDLDAYLLSANATTNDKVSSAVLKATITKLKALK